MLGLQSRIEMHFLNSSIDNRIKHYIGMKNERDEDCDISRL